MTEERSEIFLQGALRTVTSKRTRLMSLERFDPRLGRISEADVAQLHTAGEDRTSEALRIQHAQLIATPNYRESIVNSNMQQMGTNIEQVRRSQCAEMSKFKSDMCTSQ